jgi:hypothetical protein
MTCLPAAPNWANCGAPKRIVEPHATVPGSVRAERAQLGDDILAAAWALTDAIHLDNQFTAIGGVYDMKRNTKRNVSIPY